MELRHLRYFVTLAEELHFGKAAEKLHIAQPPLSQQIRQLETELGFELFHRTKRKVELSEAGEVFLVEVQQIFRQLEQAIFLGRQVSRGEIGQLVVGFVSSAAYNILPNILQNTRNSIPNVSLELHELTTDEQLRWLQSGRIDVGFVRPPVDENTYESKVIFQESLAIALPQNHFLANQDRVSLQSLKNESFILFPRFLAPGLYDQIISFCQQVGFSPKVAQEAIQMQTIVSLVAAEIGVAIVPESLQNLRRTGVIYKYFVEKTPQVSIAIIWRKNDVSVVLDRFLEVF
ncbi:LysR family transcriptional regulator [Rivularia sp. UHCC 0363]|uniref:LysR family transcriptional regulator n=1 Tax=Rivularia sp. UHCC 0363 TaxID=3110244 RepID=UPI002B1F941A|nr:LysR family transcriptional regulator [Rivularia sp. UHCC 0363]MEA5593679.1 LysR family transcriptional regulator [Rivularia sp. UHCC 0363]